MSSTRRPSPGAAIEEVAGTVERLAVLIGAGVAPPTAWRLIADRIASPIVAQAADASQSGRSVGAAIARASEGMEPALAKAWRSTAAAWAVAIECGSPLSASLSELASAFRSAGRTQRELEAAWAGPRATARLIGALPAVGMLFGVLMGFDTLRTLFASPPGWACLALGSAFMVAGASWNRRLLRRAQPLSAAPGLGIDLTGIALSGGCSVDRARSIVRVQLARCGLQSDPGEEAVVSEVVSLAAAAGAPATELLRSEAMLVRHRARMNGQTASAVLAVRLTIPLALCFLPAFLVLGVAPVVFAVVSSTFSSI